MNEIDDLGVNVCVRVCLCLCIYVWAHWMSIKSEEQTISYPFKNYLEEELKYYTMNNVGINLTYKCLKHNRFDDTFDLTVLCDVRISLNDKQTSV